MDDKKWYILVDSIYFQTSNETFVYFCNVPMKSAGFFGFRIYTLVFLFQKTIKHNVVFILGQPLGDNIRAQDFWM